MKRITIILALLVAIALPALSYAQSDRPIERAQMGGGNSAQFGGVGHDSTTLPFSGIRNNSRSLSDDLQAGVDFNVDTDPIMACSGLDLRATIKGMFDLSSLADDVKNYLTSLLAKQALSLVYANPAIAGVLDGLKAFGNSRFQLAQTSCEAIEAEVSAESRHLRQQAFENCLQRERAKGNDNPTYDCSTETGNYIGTNENPGIIKEMVNSAEYQINSTVHGWTSRINYGGQSFQSRMCGNMTDGNRTSYCTDPSSQAQAEYGNIMTPDGGSDPDGNTIVTPPAVAPAEVFDEAVKAAKHAHALYAGVMVAISALHGGNIKAALRTLNKLIGERKAYYRQQGILRADTGSQFFDRKGAAGLFITAERHRTAAFAANLASQFGGNAHQHPDLGNGAVGTHTENSAHYRGLGADLYGGNMQGMFEEAVRQCEAGAGCSQVIFGNRQWRRGQGVIPYNRNDHNDHVHIGMQGSGQEYDIRGADGATIDDIEETQAGLEPSETPTGPDPALDIMRKGLKKVPLTVEEACFYDLYLDDENKGLSNISNITDIFGLNIAINRMIQASKGEDQDDSAGAPGAEGAVQLGQTLLAKIQEMNRTIGRLAVCYMVTTWEPANIMQIQFLNADDAGSYINSMAMATAGQAALTLYDALIYQVSMAGIMAANDKKAPPTIGAAFTASIKMLESMRDSLKGTLERQDALSARQRALNAALKRQEDQNTINFNKREQARGINAGKRY